MLPCIVCTKRADDEDEDAYNANTPKSFAERVAMKSLTSQLKDMVLKASATYRQCKPGSAAIFDHGAPSFKEYAAISNVSSEGDHLKSSQQFALPISKSEEHVNASSPRPQGIKANYAHGEEAYSHSRKPFQVPQQEIPNDKSFSKDDQGQEWVAQVEPGVLITFLALSDGGNELRRIRFNREMFNKRQAESWWTLNSERVHELYNVCLKDKSAAGLRSANSSNEVKSLDELSPSASPNSPRLAGDTTNSSLGPSCKSSTSNPGSETVNNDVADVAASGASSTADSEWVTEDEPGVFVTVKIMPGGTKTLKRVRFSCDTFNEQQAKLWWEKNRFRIHEQYLRKNMPGASYTSI
ncbi:hypothetical protein O6H91_02G118800 [Diphasiastrum complanatum]|uniref:Uncharacterized protein n=1 Tax=Diphasiastrum complanatum TaxID=34168 RepID=A0ACC2EK19_DIPCM|nr:hypothetical protein O6H91_02G118800 [Diphasiastrum complanatum]